MADFMTAVKTLHRKTGDEEPEPALKEIASQPSRRNIEPPNTLITTKHQDEGAIPKVSSSLGAPEEALQLMKSQPDTDDLIRALKKLRYPDGFGPGFNLRSPGPLQAQIINSLVTTVVPTFWDVLAGCDQQLLASCLRGVAGANAVAARIRLLCDSLSTSPGSSEELKDLLQVSRLLFAGDDLLHTFWSDLCQAVTKDAQRSMLWKEFVNLVGSGKVIATIARAEDVLRGSDIPVKTTWLSNGAEYSAWVGRNIALLSTLNVDDELAGPVGSKRAAAEFLAKAFSLGYLVPLTEGLLMPLIRSTGHADGAHSGLSGLVKYLPPFAKRQLVDSTLRWTFSINDTESTHRVEGLDKQKGEVSAIAALLSFLCKSDEFLPQLLLDFLRDPSLLASISFPVRRACILVLQGLAADELQPLLERLMTTFNESLFINHAPILQQESVAQTILLTAGYLHRSNPIAVLMTARSSSHMRGVSDRLASTKAKARWLGMICGTALSSLVDKDGSKMNFGTEDMQTDEAKWYLDLVKVTDTVGALTDYEKLLKERKGASRPKKRTSSHQQPGKLPILNGKQTFGPAPPPRPVQTEVIGEKVSEILDDEGEEDDDLKPYAKPDSDPEDSDEDATLVNRNKARAPAYIRDLMRMLKDDKDHDRFQIGMKHAPALIRRKANFGGEVKDHAEEIALMLCDLQDPFQTEDFEELKLQALIAVLRSDVTTMAPWLSKQAFIGDYSLSQRCIMLSALGLGGRELAGFKNQDDLNPALPESAISFPSKRLPNRLHAIYTPADASVKRLEAASKNIEHQLMKPVALSAADGITSHLNAVKVRTFSSRMDIERTKRKPAANQLAKIFGASFFFPLVSTYQQEMGAYGQSSVFASAPFVLVTFIKTLALLLHAAGPATMDLAEISTAFWDLLLSLRVKAISDISILEPVLFSLLTLLEINSDNKQRIAQEMPKQLMETQQWVELVFEKTGGGELITEGSGEEVRVRTLSAGVLVKTKDIIGAYQQMLMRNTYG